MLYAVGKPVYHKFTEQNYGAWLKDPAPKNDIVAEKIWSTRENDSNRLYEYSNKISYRNNIAGKTYRIEPPFRGNSHVIYNGSFYYNDRDEPRITRYDIVAERKMKSLDIPGLSYNSSNYLYTTEHNYIDINVDDNGLWVIYATPHSNNTIVAKVREINLFPI